MKLLLTLLAMVGAGLFVYSAISQPDAKKALRVSMKDLPDFNGATDYKVDPYIAAGVEIQAQGKEKAAKLLMELAKEPGHGQKAIVLCRMLFVGKPKLEFRPPALGLPSFLGETDHVDWPLVPIEVVDGVPFLIVTGYALGGKAERAESYLAYCLSDCEWQATEFGPRSPQQKQRALDKLMANQKWKVRLTDQERQFLNAQIN